MNPVQTLEVWLGAVRAAALGPSCAVGEWDPSARAACLEPVKGVWKHEVTASNLTRACRGQELSSSDSYSVVHEKSVGF